MSFVQVSPYRLNKVVPNLVGWWELDYRGTPSFNRHKRFECQGKGLNVYS